MLPTNEILFRPGDDVQKRIVAELQKAKTSIFVQAYQLTAPAILAALTLAQGRGVPVVVVLDKAMVLEPGIAALHASGVNVSFDFVSGIAHCKLIVIDLKTVLGGSYNYSENAEHRNVENLTVCRSQSIVDRAFSQIKTRLDRAKPFPIAMKMDRKALEVAIQEDRRNA